jgi:hypothetical protein
VESDPRAKKVTKHPMWVKLPRLALELYTVEALKAIEQCLGNFVEVDEHFTLSTGHSIAHVLVELDLQNGLFEAINIEVGSCCYN